MNSALGTLLIIDDEQDICLLLSKFFSKKGFKTATASSGEEGVAWLKENKADVVLCDFKLPDYTGLEILQKIKVLHPSAKVIIITGYSDVRIAVQALKKGASDYVTKPLYPDEIFNTVQTALQKGSSKEVSQKSTQKKQLKSPKVKSSSDFVTGESEASKIVVKHIDLIAPTDMSVIVLGETGTGKEYVAKAIHHKSQRSGSPFIAIDCGALPGELAGSELFGHVKGAFTGALQDKKGCFELADGGTLFLDEIGNLSYENQIKLLRVLQERKVRRLGDAKEISVDVRLVVATNENLKEQIKADDFREDLYHRLNEFRIELSPLRQRTKDISIFAHHFLKEANEQLQKAVKGFDKEAENVLLKYYWHGNLRELRNVIKRAVLLTTGDSISISALPSEIIAPDPGSDEDVLALSFNGTPTNLKSVAEQAEKKAILKVLEQTQNNKSKTADLLEIDRKTLYNKMRAYGIEH